MCVASNNLYKVAACLSCSNSRVSVPGRELQPTVGCGQVCNFAHLVEVVEVSVCTFLVQKFHIKNGGGIQVCNARYANFIDKYAKYAY